MSLRRRAFRVSLRRNYGEPEIGRRTFDPGAERRAIMRRGRPDDTAAVIGRSVSGLAAAERLIELPPIGTATLRCEPGYVTERDVVERR